MATISVKRLNYFRQLEEVLDDISGVCVNYDDYETVDGLKGLIDDIREMAGKALEGEYKRISLDKNWMRQR